ncbi:MAG: winged helix-turn-helix transcriptional regulator [Methylacidiphilales bacterium]|nr:winged helix-turn-helix transcriptional regulator [Candidatus Methylacidiphilales bacterium]MDW8348818.1 winged helix-turn-helix transcriptional regulator [Verrucomicrobiae bacterium]
MKKVVNKKNKPGWTFLTNHTHVLICLRKNRMMRLREVAEAVGITERAVQKIVADLIKAGVLIKKKSGRCNSYEICPDIPLRHPLEAHRRVGDLLRLARGG